MNQTQCHRLGKPSPPSPAHDHYLTRTQWAELHQELLGLQAQTRATMERLREELREPTECSDELDLSVQRGDRDRLLMEARRKAELMREIDHALARLGNGSYGYCEETGEPIGYERLRARPFASLSVYAKERQEYRRMVYCA